MRHETVGSAPNTDDVPLVPFSYVFSEVTKRVTPYIERHRRIAHASTGDSIHSNN